MGENSADAPRTYPMLFEKLPSARSGEIDEVLFQRIGDLRRDVLRYAGTIGKECPGRKGADFPARTSEPLPRATNSIDQ